VLTRVKHPLGLHSKSPSLDQNIRRATNPLAYHSIDLITTVESFIVLGPDFEGENTELTLKVYLSSAWL
jgi:hypothetical protein